MRRQNAVCEFVEQVRQVARLHVAFPERDVALHAKRRKRTPDLCTRLRLEGAVQVVLEGEELAEHSGALVTDAGELFALVCTLVPGEADREVQRRCEMVPEIGGKGEDPLKYVLDLDRRGR